MNKVICGNALKVLPTIEPETFHCCVTSPPYWGLRSYGEAAEMVFGGEKDCRHEWSEGKEVTTGRRDQDRDTRHTDGRNPATQGLVGCPQQKTSTGQFCSLCGAWRGQFGLEPTPEMYVAHTLEFLRAIRRVLRKDGTVWWIIGDSYSAASTHKGGDKIGPLDSKASLKAFKGATTQFSDGLTGKQLVMIPFRIALAAQADGWWMRSVVIWNKPNPTPQSARDRPTTSHEYVLLLARRKRYFCDMHAIREPSVTNDPRKPYGSDGAWALDGRDKWEEGAGKPQQRDAAFRNKRTVWTITAKPFKGAHFATFPPDLIEPMILTTPTKCCAECGAGWERVTKVGVTAHTGKTESLYPDGSSAKRLALLRQQARTLGGEYANQRDTLGFRPTCSCFGKPEYGMVTCPSCEGSGVTKQRDGSERRCGRCRGKAKIKVFAYNGFGFPAKKLKSWPTKPAVVVDLFAGTGTVGEMAEEHGRGFTLIELVPEYIPFIKKRLSLAAPKEIRTKTDDVFIQTALPFEDRFEIIDDSTKR